MTEAESQLFWDKVDKSGGPLACWPWTCAKTPLGYGRASDVEYAHRIALELATGTSGRVAMHACDTPSCCNPAHLSWGTHSDNSQDMVAKGRSTRGEKHGRAQLTASDVESLRAAFDAGESRPALAKRFKISVRTVYNIGKRETWRAPGEPSWRLAQGKARALPPDVIDVEAP